jgi:hypothetical protein
MSNQQTNTNYNNENECIVIPAAELRAENFVIYPPRENKKRKSIQAILRYNYNGTEITPYIETPEALVCKFGLSNYKDGPSYNIPLSSYSRIKSEKPVVDHFFTEMMKLDKRMIDYGMEHSKLMFGKQYTSDAQREIVESKYKSCVKQKINEATGEPYPPGLAPKVPKVWNPDDEKGSHGIPDVEVFRSSSGEEPINFGETWQGLRELIPKETNTPLTLIFQPRTHFVSGFGISLRVNSIKIVEVKRQPRPKGWVFSRREFKESATNNENPEEEVTKEDVEGATQEAASSSEPVQANEAGGASKEESAEGSAEEEIEDSDGGETTDSEEEVEEVVE